ncbi:MAG: hypothetical protein ACJ8DC_00320 [Gemmatimonadales bacterium]
MRCAMSCLLVGALACGAASPARVPAKVAPWLRADPQRCLLRRDLREGMEVMARRCAELFVLDNGYTDVPATDDSTRWVQEVGDRGPWRRVLSTRRGTLDGVAATVQCSARSCTVLFRAHRPALACGYRPVTMTQVFTRLQLEPQVIQDVRCYQRRS